MKPQATIGCDAGKENGGFGSSRPDGRGGFAFDGWEWQGPEAMAAALARLRLEIRQLRAAGYDVTVYVERAFVPREKGKFRGAGLVQSEAVGRVKQVCGEEGAVVVEVATQTWRSRWGMNPKAGEGRLKTASRGWGRVLLGADRIGKGDHLCDGLLLGTHAVPEAILYANRVRSAAAGTKAARQLDRALLRVTSGAVSLMAPHKNPPGATPGAKVTRRGAVVWTPAELAAYRERIGR